VPACSQGAVGSTIVQDAAEPNTAEEPETNFARAQQPEEISDDEDFLETRVVGSPEDQPSENLLDTPEEGQSLLQDLQAGKIKAPCNNILDIFCTVEWFMQLFSSCSTIFIL